jgi:putative SOS response-associated peptidase YedK
VLKDKGTDQTVESFTIITADPNALMEPFHDRMPVILRPDDYERWLAPADPVQLPIVLLRPYFDDQMTAWKVSKDIGNVKNNRPDLIDPN